LCTTAGWTLLTWLGTVSTARTGAGYHAAPGGIEGQAAKK